MKFHKIISRTIVSTALLGITLSGAFSGISASADNNSTNDKNQQQDDTPITKETQASPSTHGNFQVNGGFLTLDNVPTLNFGNNQNTDEHSSNVLKLNNDNNQNNSGVLEVTDYRNNSNSNDWKLTANMGNVKQNNGNNNQKINTQWKMNLFNQNTAQNFDGNRVPNLNDTTQLTNGSQSNIMYKNSGTGNDGYGVNQISYNNGNDANLIIPNVSKGDYSAEVTWNLGTNVSSSNNSGISNSTPGSSSNGTNHPSNQ